MKRRNLGGEDRRVLPKDIFLGSRSAQNGPKWDGLKKLVSGK